MTCIVCIVQHVSDVYVYFALLPSVGPGADPGVQPAGDCKSFPGGRLPLPLLSARPGFTFVSIHQMAPTLSEVTAYNSSIDPD